MHKVRALAADLGASGGRVILGAFDGERVELREVHRFPNEPVEVNGILYWDVLRLFHELKRGLAKAEKEGGADSIGVDTWGVDFGLLGKDGQLLSNPLHYRASLARRAQDVLSEGMPLSEIYQKTGIAFNEYNTLGRLAVLQKEGSAALAAAECALFMPDLFTYFLTGNKVCEHSIAGTSQLLKAGEAEYCGELFKRFGLRQLFPPVVPSGTVAGSLKGEIVRESGLKRSIPVIATLGHDTASAFFAAPSEKENAAVLSSGTWSLLGTIIQRPVVTEAAYRAGYTNEIGYGKKVRFLRNIVGLWIIQECRRSWEREGVKLTFSELAAGAEKCEAGRCYIDPDAEEFYFPHAMPQKIADFCRRTGQYVPQNAFETARCVYDSLAQSYKKHLRELEILTGRKIEALHIVGGGANNEMLNRAAAKAAGIRVTAGPAEGTALGNILCQLIALGVLRDEKEAKTVAKNSCRFREYTPR